MQRSTKALHYDAPLRCFTHCGAALRVHVRALEEDLCALQGVEQLLGLAAVGLQLLARHLQRVHLQRGT